MKRPAAAAGLLIAAGAVAVATAVAAPLTGNIRVNQNTAETQEAPRVALQTGGGFLVAWEERDLGNGEIYVRRFNAQGVPTDAVPVAEATLRQEAPDIDTASDDTAVVTWTDGGVGNRDVWAQRLDEEGEPDGDAIEVATGSGAEELSRVAISPDGTFSIVWNETTSNDDIYMARYEANGELIDDFPVADDTGFQVDPDVAALPDGTLVVVFADSQDRVVRARRFQPDGDQLGDDITVGTDVDLADFFGPGRPSVEADTSGFTVAYELDRTTFVRRFGLNGAPLTGPVTVSAVPFDDAFTATAPDGRSVVAWTDSDDVAKLKEYSAALVPDGGAQSASSGGSAGLPHTRGVAADAAGFVVVWEGDDDDTDVYARRFSWGGGGAPPTPIPTAVPTAAPTAVPVTPAKPKPKAKPKPPKLADIVRGLPSTKKCVSRRNFRIRLREPKGTQIRRATVKVNGKLVATRKGKRVTAPVDLRGLPKGRFKVEIRATTTTGRVIKGSRKYRTCAKRKKKPS